MMVKTTMLLKAPMSGLGQSEKSVRPTGKSALTPTPDMSLQRNNRRYVPLAEVIRSSLRPANTGCDGHSGSPACRNPSSNRETSSARR
jgi:hypothetical protein